MKKLLLIGWPILLACICAAAPWFSGRIVYHSVFVTLAGDTIQSNLSRENWFYIHGDKYKTYSADKKLLDLYAGKNTIYQSFRDGKPVAATDSGGRRPSLIIKRLPTTATILGYSCRALQIKLGDATSVVYYTDELRVNPAGFRHDTNGYWYELLKATNGALPLRIIGINSAQGFTATSEAVSVKPMLLSDQEFTATAPAR